MQGKLSALLILLAAVLWGTTGTTQAFAPESAHPIAIGTIRLAIGGLFLLSLVFLFGKLELKKLAKESNYFGSFEHGSIPAIVFLCRYYHRSGYRNSSSNRKCTDFIRAAGMDIFLNPAHQKSGGAPLFFPFPAVFFCL